MKMPPRENWVMSGKEQLRRDAALAAAHLAVIQAAREWRHCIGRTPLEIGRTPLELLAAIDALEKLERGE